MLVHHAAASASPGALLGSEVVKRATLGADGKTGAVPPSGRRSYAHPSYATPSRSPLAIKSRIARCSAPWEPIDRDCVSRDATGSASKGQLAVAERVVKRIE